MVKYSYDAWGNHTTVDTSGLNLGNLNPFRYRGYYYDTETGLYYLQTRYYDPETGRFISQDDVSYLNAETVNGLNLYAYCGNNPVMRTDSTGTNWWTDFWNSTAGKVVGTILITAAVIATVIAVTILTAGIGTAVAGALGGGFAATLIGGAVGGAITGAITGAIFGAGISAVSQGISGGYANTSLGQVGMAALKGGISGAIGGAVFGVASSGIARGLQALGNSGKLTRAGISLGKSVKILSPNKASCLGTKFAGGTLVKIGKTTRLDVEVGRMLHVHPGIFMKTTIGQAISKWHISLAWTPGLNGGIKGGFQ